MAITLEWPTSPVDGDRYNDHIWDATVGAWIPISKITRPSFQAHGPTTGSTASGSYLIFNSEKFDIGGNYDLSTGIFTAPFDGTYFFTWSHIAGTADQVFRYWLYLNNVAIGDLQLRIDCTATGTEYAGGHSQTALLDLVKGDEVRIYFSSGGIATYNAGDHYELFGGHFVS